MTEDSDESLLEAEPLDQVIAEYISCTDAGRPPDRDEFVSRYPALAGELRRYFANADLFDTHLPRQPRIDPFQLPRRLGRIDLRAVLGRGAFGTVYKGWDEEMGRWVAVKAMRVAPGSPPRKTAKALREARIAAQLAHPNIVRVHDIGASGGVPYIVSEYVAGPTLAAFMREDRPPIAEAVRVIAAVADALHHAHGRGVVHRDVKPANVILRDGRVPLLTDFGLALWHAGDETVTADGRVVGTAEYMSPEQARGTGDVDPRSDVYSLGVMLYELLTGERPFVGTARGVLYQAEHDEPRPPRRLDDRVPRDLDTVCVRCLQKEPARRYKSAADLAADLRRYLDGKPVLARPIGRAERLTRWARRKPAAAAALALLVVTACVSVGWALDARRRTAEVRQALGESRRVTAETQFDRGLAEAERGDVGLGMLWMARSLETAPEVGDRTWAVRANLNAWQRQLATLTAHTESPPGRVLAFSPDGTRAWFVAADRQTVRGWDVAAARVTGPDLRHPKVGVDCAAVSPDGTRVALGGASSGVSIWGADSGTPEGTPSEAVQVRGLAYSAGAGGERILAITTPVGFRTWDGRELRPLGEWAGGSGTNAMAATSDGQTLFTAGQWEKDLRTWDAADGIPRDRVLRHPTPVNVVAVSPNGTRVLTGGDDRVARLWDVSSGQLLCVLHHRTPVTAVAFGPRGRLLTASRDDAIRVWDAPPDDRGLTLPAVVLAVAVSRDGSLVATGTGDRCVQIWTTAGGRLEPQGKPIPPHLFQIRCLTFSDDGRTLAVTQYGAPGVELWNPVTGEHKASLAHPVTIRQVCASPDGTRVVTVGYDGTVRVWDGWSGRPAAPHLIAADGVTTAAAFHPAGRELVTAAGDGSVHHWDITTGAHLGGAEGPGGLIDVIRFHPTNPRTMLTAGGGGLAQVWDANSFTPAGPSLTHGHPIVEADFSPDGRTVLTGGRDGKTRVWSLDSGVESASPLRHGGLVRAAGVSPSGRWAATASDDGTARVWALPSGRMIGPPVSHGRSAMHAVIDPRERWVATAGYDKTIRLHPAPAEKTGEPKRISEWVRAATGVELDARGDLRPVSRVEWQRAAAAGDTP